MQKLKLFSQFTVGALFMKASKEIEDQVEQWPKEYLCDDQMGFHCESLRTRLRLDLPELDFANGTESLEERVFPLSVFQPGRKSNVNLRVNVLRYHYPFEGAMYLLGCRPAMLVPEPAGDWFADSARGEIWVEYTEYEKYPKNTIAAHHKYAAGLQQCYEMLKHEIEDFNKSLDGTIEAATGRRLNEISEIRRIVALLQ